MNKTTRWVLAVIAVQAVLIGVYWNIEHQDGSEALLTDPPQRVDWRMPSLTVRRHDGGTMSIASVARPTLVHIWATWCPPCRAELPGLLTLPNRHPVDVMAIALDNEWPDVERFLGDLSTTNVLLGDAGKVKRALGIRTLPVTFLVQPGGLITLRFDGARDWTNASYVYSWTSTQKGKPSSLP